MDPVTLTAIGSTLLRAGPGLIRGIGSLFGGKTAEVADTVAGITEVVAGKPDQEQQLQQALQNLPPEQLLELKNLGQQLQVELKRIEAEREARRLKHQETMNQQHLGDTQDARKTHKDHWMPSVLTIGLFLMMSAVTWALFEFAIPKDNRDLVVYVAGQIAGFFATGVGYWLGTSRSSKEKDLAKEGGRD